MHLLAPVRRRTTLRVGVALALVAVLAQGCAGAWWAVGGASAGLGLVASRMNPLYGGQHRDRSPIFTPDPRSPGVRMSYLELDDRGWFWDRSKPRELIDSLASLAAHGNVAVVVYVHGWRHNLGRRDRDVESFSRTIGILGSNVVQGKVFRDLRRRASGDPNTTLVGIQIGWRGKMWPECPPLSKGHGFFANATNLPMFVANVPIYFTFWSRKAAAERIGHGDLSEFLGDLDALYRRMHDDPHRLMTMVVVGHSFGGQAVFDATRERIESHFASAIAQGLGPKGPTPGHAFYPPAAGASPIRVRERVRGFGDLVVLINPAIEAETYHRIDQFVRSLQFGEVDFPQQPILLVVSAKNDVARGKFFRIGRWFSTFGARTQGHTDQKKLLRSALGAYEPQVTDDLELRDDSPATIEAARRTIRDPLPDRAPAPVQQVVDSNYVAQKLDITHPSPDRPLIVRTPRKGEDRPLPARVMVASPHVIDGHSDFFRVEFIHWLANEVLAIQSARLNERGVKNRS